MKKIVLKLLLGSFISTFIIGCSNSTNNNIEGHYLVIDANGTQEKSMDIEKDDEGENMYRIKIYRTSGVLEWDNLIVKKEPGENKVVWSDKWIPVEMTFDGDKAVLSVGNGTYGIFTFQRQNN